MENCLVLISLKDFKFLAFTMGNNAFLWRRAAAYSETNIRFNIRRIFRIVRKPHFTIAFDSKIKIYFKKCFFCPLACELMDIESACCAFAFC